MKTQVLEVFGKFGEITSTALKVDTNINKTFGFINFKNHEDAKKAYTALLDQDPFGKSI